jgi:hypothetical protein
MTMSEGKTQLVWGALIAALLLVPLWMGNRLASPVLFGMPLYDLMFLFGACGVLVFIGRTALSPPQGREAMQSAVILLLAPLGLLGVLNGKWDRLIQVFAIVAAIAAVVTGLSLLIRRARLEGTR